MHVVKQPAYFSNKVFIVTGGSDGIGKALVGRLLHSGAQVATCGRNPEKLAALANLYPQQPLLTYVADVSRPEDCKQFIDAALQRFHQIDGLINNAGISMRAEFSEVTFSTLHQLMDVNFWGTVYCTKYCLPSLLATKGDIAGISSIAGYRGLPGRAGYSASKWAMQGFLESLRTELLHKDVNVSWICPGFTASNIRNAALNKLGEAQGESPLDEKALMTADACAVEILNAIAAKKRTLVMTGQGKQTVFLNKFFPRLADRLVRNFFYKANTLIR